jgi:hypothetical protein
MLHTSELALMGAIIVLFAIAVLVAIEVSGSLDAILATIA